jgi:hypothetical protein
MPRRGLLENAGHKKRPGSYVELKRQLHLWGLFIRDSRVKLQLSTFCKLGVNRQFKLISTPA